MTSLATMRVPEQLRSLRGWLIWRYEQFSGEAKPRKIPFWADGIRRYGAQGGPHDRDRLTTFVAAREAALRLGFGGIGLSRGVPWRDHRVPKSVRVLYVAAEGSGGVGNRIKAYLKEYGIERPHNLSVMPATPSLMMEGDLREVLASVTAADGFDVIIIDTFAQVTPGANENAADDMGRALANLRALAEATQAMPILVHHAGKDASKGARGWSGLKAAADVQIEVIRRESGAREIHVEKLKDGEDGARFGFELEAVDLGVDEYGDPVSSCVIRHTDAAPIQSRSSQVGPRGDNQRKVFDCAKEAGAGLPQGALTVEVIDRAIGSIPYDPASSDEGKPKRDQRRGHVIRALRSLCDRGLLVTQDDRIHLASTFLGA